MKRDVTHEKSVSKNPVSSGYILSEDCIPHLVLTGGANRDWIYIIECFSSKLDE